MFPLECWTALNIEKAKFDIDKSTYRTYKTVFLFSTQLVFHLNSNLLLKITLFLREHHNQLNFNP